jgi:hypothetical protein
VDGAPRSNRTFSPDEVAVVHVMNRVVRRCFLLGNDPLTGKNYGHRKVWVEDHLRHLASAFEIDLLCFSILSNHFHLILRSRPDCVEKRDDTEVARRWLKLCPFRKDAEHRAEEPNEMELNTIRNDPDRLKLIRSQLGRRNLRLEVYATRVRLPMRERHSRSEPATRRSSTSCTGPSKRERCTDSQPVMRRAPAGCAGGGSIPFALVAR